MKRTLYQFHGGLILDARKDKQSKRPIAEPIIAPEFILPLRQHIGNQGELLVSKGEAVLKGQALTASSTPSSVPIHAPTSGTILNFETREIAHPSGLGETCIILKSDFEDRWIKKIPLKDYQNQTLEKVLSYIHDAGIAGLGGAGFPTRIKLDKQNNRIDTLIINGAECEPYISADDALMRERAEDILAGVTILAWLTKPKEILFAIEDNKPEALRRVKEALQGHPLSAIIEIIQVPTIYPTGGEKQLIQVLTGKEVPSNGLPQDLGILCQNTGTAYAIQRAIQHGEPLISRVVTVAGDAVSKPGNFEVYLGTPLQDLLAYAEQSVDSTIRLIMGGPLMGLEILNTKVPVIKTTNCIIAATEKEMPTTPPEQPCIRCGACEEVCPASLLPQQLYWYIQADNLKTAEGYQLFDCIECGACAYVCPSHIPLVQYYRHGKAKIKTEVKEKSKSEQARNRFESRTRRLEQEKLEREERRKQAKTIRENQAKLTGIDAKKNEIAAAIARAKAKKEDKSSE